MLSSLYALARPLLFRLPPSTAHELAFAALGATERLAALRRLLGPPACTRDARLAVRTMGLTFPNPVGLAGGFDKDARRPASLAALGFGHVELGTVTARAQAANPAPNLFRLPADRALVNRLGFPNAGADALAARVRGLSLGVPLGVSIGKSRVVDVDDEAAVLADYEASLRAVAGVADFVVVNVSSPNTPNLRAMQRADSARALLSHLLRARGDAGPPMLLKVAPDLDADAYVALLGVVRDVGLAGVVATNTTLSRDGLATPAARVAEIGAGGLSGPPLRERSRKMVRVARTELGSSATVIGVGGISSADDVERMRDAGADLCQLYTGFIYEGPSVVADICRALTTSRSGAPAPASRARGTAS